MRDDIDDQLPFHVSLNIKSNSQTKPQWKLIEWKDRILQFSELKMEQYRLLLFFWEKKRVVENRVMRAKR